MYCSGSSVDGYRACFGSKRSRVQVPPPRFFLEIVVADTLLVVPVQFRHSLNSKEQSIVNSVVKNYEFFYRDGNSIEKFKECILVNKSLKEVVFYSADIVFDYRLIRALRALKQNIKIILINPQLQNFNFYLDCKENIFDDIYKLLKMASDMEISNCKIADLIVVPEECDKKNLAKKGISYVSTYDDILKNRIEYKKSQKYLVSIVILTYNQLEDTKICVESLFKHTTDVSFEIIFVDNGSTKDDTKLYLEALKKEYKNVKTIYNEENLGFACANNQGIEISEGEYVVLLNNDVILTDGWLSRMLNVAESDSNIGLVAPCTNHASGRQVVTFAGTEEDDDEIQKFSKTTLLNNAGRWISVNRIIGFCMLIKREVLFRVGVLDEMFGPGGYEDYDYCMRVKHEGYDIVIAMDTFIFHIGGKGYTSNDMDYTHLRSKNIELLVDKWNKNILEAMEKIPDGMI